MPEVLVNVVPILLAVLSLVMAGLSFTKLGGRKGYLFLVGGIFIMTGIAYGIQAVNIKGVAAYLITPIWFLGASLWFLSARRANH